MSHKFGPLLAITPDPYRVYAYFVQMSAHFWTKNLLYHQICQNYLKSSSKNDFLDLKNIGLGTLFAVVALLAKNYVT